MIELHSIMRTIQIFLLTFTFLFLAGCQSATNSRAPQQNELRQASAEWDRLFNAADASKLGLLYAEDAISMPPNNPTIRGRQAIQADFESLFASNVARHETKLDEILMEGNLAIEVAHYRLTYKPRSGGPEIVESGKHLECRGKIDGQWKIMVEIWNLDTPTSVKN
jgi:ketosteroid isomerase-like protein